ncbi:MAG TPA: TIGR03435 family protein [Bryobacteraceae bacterium]|jgi:uncharacterized protein (TIGR03435 family)|nr:TIGR03435 family protein [Bryobacteraceae bacterium]
MKLVYAFLPIVLLGQTAQFEVASIRPSPPPGPERMNVGVHIDGARVSCTALNLKDYISAAYKIKIYQIEGPDFLGSERFDINAKLPAGAAEAQVPDMIKALLAERFQMKAHRETKDFPVYALVVAKGGLKMKESPVDPNEVGDPGEKPKAPATNVTGSGGRGGVHLEYGHGSFFTMADNKFIARKLAIANFVEVLARFEDKPVVDMTGLTGSYDFDLEFTQEDYMAMLIRSAIAAGITMPPEALRMLSGSSGDSLTNALERLGLKLENRKAPLEVLVVDRIEKAPTEN